MLRISNFRPLEIVIAVTQKLWHGGEQQAALLADGILRQGHRCRVLAPQDSAFGRLMQRRGFTVETFMGRGRGPAAMWKMRQLLKEWRPDVLYLNDSHAVTAAGVAAVGLGVPLTVAVRRVDFDVRSALRYRHTCDAVICVSRAVRDICETGGLPAEMLTVIHDGVDPQRTASGNRRRGRTALGLTDETKLVLTVARMTDHKGHRYMLDAMPQLVRKYPELIWVLAGDGPLWEELSAHAFRLGVQEHVRFLGFRQDVDDLLAAADALIVPSHLEGLCSSIIDAMMCSRPVIATHTGGIPDLLARDDAPRDCGWLVPAKQPAALAKAVSNVFEFPNLTSLRVCDARRRALESFTAERMVESSIEFFQSRLSSVSLAPAA